MEGKEEACQNAGLSVQAQPAAASQEGLRCTDRAVSEPASLAALPTLGKKDLPKGNDRVILVKHCFFGELEQETNLACTYSCQLKTP